MMLKSHPAARFTVSILALTAGLAAEGLCAVAPVAAQAAESATAHADIAVNIPSGRLDLALTQLSRASNIAIVADPALLAGRSTHGVSGRMTLDKALRTLLRDQPLSYTFDGDTVVIRPGTPAAVHHEARAARTDAQPATASAPADAAATEVVVTGIRNSLAKSLNQKRHALNVVDVISAEDIGKFPANNVAEALQRVPGVAITRDRGEGLFVRVRGLGANFQTTTINGRSAAVNENVRDSGQSGRQFRFDTLASELVSGVEVIKSPLPSLEEGAIGGVVNIKTFRPFDFTKPTFAASVSASYPQLADKVDPKASLLASWANQNRTFGVLVSLTRDERHLRQDRITGVSWAQSNGVDTNGDSVADSGAIILPSSVRPTLEREHRKRTGITGALQWRPSESTEVNFDLLYSKLNDHYDELTYSADFDTTKIVPGTAVIRNGALVGGTVTTSTQIGREVSDLEHTNALAGLNIVHKAGDWKLSADISSGRAYSNTTNPITRTRILGSVGKVSFSLPDADEGVPSLAFLNADLSQPNTLPGRRIEWRVNHSTDIDNEARFDAERPLSLGILSQIAFGVEHHQRSRDYKRRDINFTKLNSGASYSSTYFDSSYFDAFPVSDFLSGESGVLPRSWVMPDPAAFWAVTNTSSLTDTSATTNRALGDYRNSYNVRENITSGYLSSQIDTHLFGGELRGEGGVRIAQTRQTSAGYATTATAAIPVSYQKTYTDTLPSISLLWIPREDIQMHASAARVITRPSLSDLSPHITLNSSGTIFTATGGNPQLNPFRANQYDLTGEWYFAPASALILGLFKKDITTFVYNQNTTITVDNQAYTLSAPVNGGKASVDGYELAYQHVFKTLPAPWDGLGVLANYTYTNSDATYTATLKDQLQNVARHSYNLTAFYEKKAIAARVSWSWVGNVLNSVGTGGFTTVNDKAFGTLDGSLSYKLNAHVSLVLEGQNLTDEAQRQFVAGNLFGGYTHYGRTIDFSVHFKY